MGVDISMSMGWGIHIPQDVFDEWLAGFDSGDGGDVDPYDVLDTLIYSENKELTYTFPGNAWLGEDNGLVIYVSETYKGTDMGRSVEAGVYQAPKALVSLEARYQLNAVSKEITGEYLPVEWLVTVGVS